MDFSVTDFNVRLRTIRLRELLAVAVIAFIVYIVISAVLPVFDGSDELYFMAFLLLMIAFFVWALRGTHGLSSNFSQIFERDNGREILYVLAINFIFALFIISFFIILEALSAPSIETVIDMVETGTEYVSTLGFALNIISSIIFAPIIEELVFRGVLFNRLKIRIGIVAAMIISSFLFALGHGFGGITSAFLFGMCMCVIYLKTDNILLTMSIHFLNNLVATVLDFTSLGNYIFEMPWAVLTFIVSTIAGVLILIYIYKNLKAFRSSS